MDKKQKAEAKRIRRVQKKTGDEETVTRPGIDLNAPHLDSEPGSQDSLPT